MKVMHGNNYKHIKNEEKKRKRNCFKYNYSNFGVFFLSLFFYPDRGFKAAAPQGGPATTFRSAIHSSRTHVGLSALR